MIATRKRVPALFRWDVRDGLGANGKLVARSFGSEIEGTFTRAGVKYVADKNGMLIPAAHSRPPLGYVHNASGVLVPAMALEPASTNLLTRSQELGDAAWTKTRTSITANALVAPDGTLTGDKLVEDATAANTHFALGGAVTIVAAAIVTGSAFVQAGTRGWAVVQVVGGGASFATYINLTTGALGSSTQIGTGTFTRAHVEEWTSAAGGTWWRVRVTGSLGGSITSAGTAVYLAEANVDPIFDGDGTGHIGVWGASLTAGHGSSYVPTAASAVTRAADSLSFPSPAAPQDLTVYVRGVNTGALAENGADQRILHIGANTPTTTPRLSIGGSSTGQAFISVADGTNFLSSFVTPSPLPVVGDRVEIRGVWDHAARRSRVGVTVNAGVESVGSLSGAGQSFSAWADDTVWLAGLSADNTAFAYESVVIAAGTKTMDEMRALAEVA